MEIRFTNRPVINLGEISAWIFSIPENIFMVIAGKIKSEKMLERLGKAQLICYYLINWPNSYSWTNNR